MDKMGINPAQTNRGGNRQGMTHSSSSHTTRGATQGGYTSSPVQTQRGLGVIKPATSLHLGDIIRGEISDLSDREITLTLEDNTMIRGQISDSSMLSIGQTAAFRLDQLTQQGVLLAPVGGYTENELTIINKALQEAGLPCNEHNQAAVKALMDTMMPINKESIQQLMQQAYDVKTEDMNTLALMNRLFIKATQDNIKQFSNYRQGQAGLAAQLQQYSQALPHLLQALSQNGSKEMVAQFAQQLLQITLSSPESVPADKTIAYLPAEDLGVLKQLLAQMELPSPIAQQVSAGTLSIKNALHILQQGFADGAITLPEEYHKSAFLADMATLESLREPKTTTTPEQLALFYEKTESENNSIPEETDTTHTPVATSDTPQEGELSEETFSKGLSKWFHSLQDTVNQSLNTVRNKTTTSEVSQHPISHLLASLGEEVWDDIQITHSLCDVLSPEERTNFGALLKQLPISEELLLRVHTGDVSVEELTYALKDAITKGNFSVLQQLFCSKEFTAILAKTLQTQWAITPEQLTQPGEPSRFLSKVAGQMQALEQLIGNSLSGSDSQEFKQEARDIQSNIQFMKELNETFTYMQLPLRLPHQNIGSELYVYTGQRQKKSPTENNRILLHLDMEHLGELEIQLDQNRQEIHALFKVDNQSSVDLLRTNSHHLQTAFSSLGFHGNIQVTKQEEAPVSLDAFLNTRIKTNATDEMKRFSFDIRA